MNWLFLRGQVPQDRDPSEIIFDRLEDSDDMWTQLFYELMDDNDQGEIWYWNGKRIHEYSENYIERYIPDFSTAVIGYTPDVIFARGGFAEYYSILRKYPNAFKIYYGAGKRFCPTAAGIKYDLILVDTEKQKKEVLSIFERVRVEVLTKPAAKMFYKRDTGKQYDVCYIANGGQHKIKGVEWVYNTVPEDLSVLHLGFPPPQKIPKNVTNYRVLRSMMPYEISRCKVGIVPYSTVDSCPRVIPEMTACGLPIVCFDTVNVSFCKYGLWPATKEKFWSDVNWLSGGLGDIKYVPNKERVAKLSMEQSAKEIRGWM